MSDVYRELKERFMQLCMDQGLLNECVRIKARVLRPEEAIGNPESDDFPLQKGKEMLMQAEFGSALGQAFTDRYGDFQGTLEDVVNTPIPNNFRRAVLVATLNAVLRFLGRIENTVHCRDEEPRQCAIDLANYIKTYYGKLKIAQVGFQPRMVESLSSEFPLRVLDLDMDNIGSRKFHTLIEGPDTQEEVLKWADLVLITGSTLVNGTIDQFLGEKPVVFYGTTIAGAAHLMGWNRFCTRSR
jgi:hypothetical protein